MDFLLDPTWFVLFGTLAGGLILKAVENFSRKADELAPTAAPAELPETSRWVCSKYEQHTFEQKLADGGVISQDEVTLCDNTNCELCKPERERRREARQDAMPVRVGKPGTVADRKRFNELQRIDKRYAGYRFEDYMFQQQMKNKNQAEKKRRVETNNSILDNFNKELEKTSSQVPIVLAAEPGPPRPAQVPDYAYATDIESGDGYHMRLWSWIDRATGKQMGLRQVMTPEFFDAHDEVGAYKKAIGYYNNQIRMLSAQ